MYSSASAICISLRRSHDWFYNWLHRYKQGDENWFKDHSRRPHHHPRKTPAKVVYEYVQATIDVGREKLTIRLDNERIEELDYPSH